MQYPPGLSDEEVFKTIHTTPHTLRTDPLGTLICLRCQKKWPCHYFAAVSASSGRAGRHGDGCGGQMEWVIAQIW